MFARVASFEGRDNSRVDELIDLVAKQAQGGLPVQGASELMMLIDREKGTAVGITFFESEEAMRDAEEAFEQMAVSIPPELRGRRTSVATYEVALQVSPSAVHA